MIKITGVNRTMGLVRLTVEYTVSGQPNQTAVLDAEDVVERLKRLRDLVGRKPTQQEAREILVKMINELRAGKQPLVEIIPWENYIGVDLEV